MEASIPLVDIVARYITCRYCKNDVYLPLNVYLPGNLGQVSTHSSLCGVCGCADAEGWEFSVLHIQKRRKTSHVICTHVSRRRCSYCISHDQSEVGMSDILAWI